MRPFGVVLLSLLPVVASADCRADEIVPLNTSRGKSHVAVRIGELTVPDILLDTGFAFDGLMIYSPAYRDSLDLDGAVEVRIGGAGSGSDQTALMLDSASFWLGDIEMTKQRIIVLRGEHYRGFPSNGIIGHSIFGHYVTELDHDDGVMTLREAGWTPPDGGWSAIPLYFKENRIPWLDASVVVESGEPVKLSMYIDYAAGDAVLLLEKPGMKFDLPRRTEKAHLGRGLSGDIYGTTGTIAKLIIGPFELKGVKASFAPATVRSKQPGADGILGVGSLRRFDLIFDYANGRMFLKPNGHFGDPYD